MKLKLAREVKIGILGILTLLIAIFGINFLKGTNLLNPRNYYYARFPESSGLNSTHAVLLSGVRIGKVDKVWLEPLNPLPVVIRFQIEGGYEIPSDSKAQIETLDLLGSKAMIILIGKSPKMAMDEDSLQGSLKIPLSQMVENQIEPLKLKVEHLITTISGVVSHLDLLLSEDMVGKISNGVADVNKTLANVRTFSEQLTGPMAADTRAVLASVKNLADKLNANTPIIERALLNAAAFTDTLKALQITKVVNDAAKAVNQVNAILASIESGEGNIGKLVKGTAIHDNLEAATKNLDNLVKDLKNNPGNYLNFSLIKINRNKKK